MGVAGKSVAFRTWLLIISIHQIITIPTTFALVSYRRFWRQTVLVAYRDFRAI